MTEPCIVLEFNELSPVLMERFIKAGHLPNFAKLRQQSLVAVSDAEEPPPALEPWIQWITSHTGLSYAEHGIFDLDDGHKLKAPRIWDVLSQNGKSVWVCGSMNAGFQGDRLNGMLVPDPWSTGARPFPERVFHDYFKFVSSYVQEYTAEKVPLSKADHARFVTFMVTHGLSPKTVSDTLRQLSSERGKRNKWRRAVILDRLQWDLFRSQYRKLQPTFSTFFINSTAHFQHYYWRSMEPDVFALKPTTEEVAEFGDAILFGYRKMDEIVGECLRLAGPETAIVLATALSQQALVKYDDAGGKVIFKPRDVNVFARFCGVTQEFTYAPVMAEQFHLVFHSEAEATDAATKLTAVTLDDGKAVMETRQDGSSLFCGCAVFASPPEAAVMRSPLSNVTGRFHDVFYQIEGMKSGHHHPDGILWISRQGLRPGVIERKVSLRELPATYLALCGQPASPIFKVPAMPEVLGQTQSFAESAVDVQLGKRDAA